MLWLKIEDFVDDEGRLDERWMDPPRGQSVILRLMPMRIVSLSPGLQKETGYKPGVPILEQLDKGAKIWERALMDGVYSVQKIIEERMFPRIPEIENIPKFRYRGEEITVYISPCVPEGKPILAIHPEDWHRKYDPRWWAQGLNHLVQRVEEAQKKDEV